MDFPAVKGPNGPVRGEGSLPEGEETALLIVEKACNCNWKTIKEYLNQVWFKDMICKPFLHYILH